MIDTIRSTRRSMLAILLALLTALLLSSPAFAEEQTPVDEPAAAEPAPVSEPAAEQEAQPAVEEPAQAPAEPEPEAEPALQEPAPAEQPVDPLPEDEPASPEQPAVEAPQEAQPEVEQPQTEAPVTDDPGAMETPVDTSVENEVVETGEQEVSALYSGLNSNVYFYDSTAGLHDTYATIGLAVADYLTENGKGMIYVTGGNYSENVTLDASLTGTSLTGLVFLDYYPTEAAKYGAAAFDPYDSDTWVRLTGSITVSDLPNFTLLGFNISSTNANAAVTVNNDNGSSGTLNLSYLDVDNTADGYGIRIQNHTGTVNISHVKSRSSSASASSGTFVGSLNPINGAVNITNSSFNTSTNIGLILNSTKLATLNGVSAVGNGNHGVEIHSAGALVKNSVFSNNGTGSSGFAENGLYYSKYGNGNLTVENSQFNGNYSSGLYADPVYGNIILKNVRADDNGNTGVSLDSCDVNVDVCQNPGSGNITITGSNMEGNGRRSPGSGLNINSAKGSVSLTNVWVSGNGDGDTAAWGAYITNEYSPTKSPVTITNSGFDNNKNNGLTVYSRGLITLKDSSASANTGAAHGARLDNDASGATAGISILNSTGRTNNFNDNAASDAGLLVFSNGAILANSIYANNTSGASGNRRGVELNNASLTSSASVKVKLGGFDSNVGGGLYVFSNGVISVILTDCSASSNSGSNARGIYLDNDLASSAKAVTLDGGSYYGNNGEGIYITSKGAITVKNVEADGSITNTGARLYNHVGSNASVTVTATRKDWTNTFNENAGYGLYISSKGSILVNRTNAEQNESIGGNLYNNYSGAASGVTVSSSNFNGNAFTAGAIGLSIYSYGSVTLKGVQANSNGDAGTPAQGAYMDNRTESGSGIGKPVTITNSQFNDNYGDGLVVESAGVLKFTGLSATNNDGSGASLYNRISGSTATSVTFTNAWFNDNGGSRGLYLESYGNVTLKNVEANNNTAGDGIYIAMLQGATPPTTTGNVSYTCGSSRCSISGNGGQGLHVDSRGNITLSYLNLSGNASGAHLVNNTAPDTAVKTVTISNSDFTGSTSTFGLTVYSKGLIKLTNVNAGDNTTYGATLDNTLSPTDVGVTLTGAGDWDWYGSNDTFGLLIATKGKVTISKVNASDNQAYGLQVDNTYAAGNQAVSISYAEISRNWHIDMITRYGLNVTSKGVITLSNVWAQENGDSSALIGVSANARLNNETSTSTAGVTLTNGYFNNAHGETGYAGDGLVVGSTGIVTITNIQASDNTGSGVSIDNTNTPNVPGVAVKRKGAFTNTFNNNGGYGLYIQSYGSISIANVDASGNGNTNAYLSNTWDDSIAKPVSILNSTFNNSSSSDGLSLHADAQVTLLNVEASGNAGGGIYAKNDYTGSYNLTATNVDVNGNQASEGLRFYSTGAVTARDLTAFGNAANGMWFGSSGQEIGNFTLSGTNFFSGNVSNGLRIDSVGNVNISQVTAEKNGNSGLQVNANAGTGTFTINKANLNYNGFWGVLGYAENTILLSGINALNNGTKGNYDGIFLTQESTGSTTIKNSCSQGNAGSGIEIDIAGGAPQPIITNTTYFGNDVDGLGDAEVFIH